MEFKLKQYHRNIPDEEMLADIVNAAKSLGKNTITAEEYSKFGKFHSSSIGHRFGSWTKALQLSGLDVIHQHYKYRDITDEEWIEDIKTVAKSLGKDTLTRKEYYAHGKYRHSREFAKRFKRWQDVLKLAGLGHVQVRKLSDEELFENLEEVWRKLGRQPTYDDMHQPLSICSAKPYVIRFGSWMRALEKFVEHVNQSETEIEPISKEEQIVEQSSSAIKHKTSRNINWRLRFLTLKKDNFKCAVCGRSPAKNPEIELHIDHIYPYSKGGETVFENLQTLCSVCNIGKSDLT